MRANGYQPTGATRLAGGSDTDTRRAFRYRGWLKLGPTDRLEIDLRLVGNEVILVSAEGSLGSWPVEEVEVIRTAGEEFALNLSGESATFLVEDVIGFAYNGLPAIQASADISPITRAFRRWRRDRKHEPLVPATSVDVEPRRQLQPQPKALEENREVARLAASFLRITLAALRKAGAVATDYGSTGARLVAQGSQVSARGVKKGLSAGRLALQARYHQARVPRDEHASAVTRNRTAGPQVHRHSYFSQEILGGITRRVCEECGHVIVVARKPATSSNGEGAPENSPETQGVPGG